MSCQVVALPVLKSAHITTMSKKDACNSSSHKMIDSNALYFWDDNVGTTLFDVTTKDNELANTMEDEEILKTMSK